jgi:hypothetical protein
MGKRWVREGLSERMGCWSDTSMRRGGEGLERKGTYIYILATVGLTNIDFSKYNKIMENI